MAKIKNKSVMSLLMVMSYKGCPVYIRQVKGSVFIWDVISLNQLYSSYIVIKPRKGEKKLSASERDEVIKMCYAGAGATIDSILGIKLTDKEEEVLKMFDEAKKVIDKGEQPNA